MVRLFDFKSDKQFIASSDKTTLKVYELSNPTIYPSYIRKTHWKEVGTIVPGDHPDDSDEDDDDRTSSYDGLMFFDGQAKIGGREALTKLAQHLARLRLMVSPQGHCFQDVTELGEHKDFGIHYLRLNDLFNWPYHGASIASVTAWPRCALKYTVPSGRATKRGGGGGVSKEKYEELKTTVRKKEEELEKLREEMEEQDDELQKLKDEMEGASEKLEAELRELEEKKDEEMRKLSKKKNDELEKLRKEKDDAIVKLRDQLSQHELEQRRKQSWTRPPTTRYITDDKVHKSRRRPVPPSTWSGDGSGFAYHYEDTMKAELVGFSQGRFRILVVDEDTKDWPAPPRTTVSTGRNKPFDQNNWWFVKIAHPTDGGHTMLAYYDGDRRYASCYKGLPTRLPLHRESDLWTSTNFFMIYLCDEFKLAFMYRD